MNKKFKMLSATNFAWRFKDYFPFYSVPSVQFKLTLREPITTAAEKILFIYFILFYLFILLFSKNKVLTFHVNHLPTKCHHLFLLFHFFFLNKEKIKMSSAKLFCLALQGLV